MKRSANKVLQYLAGNESIEAISIDDLKKLVDESPYFAVTQFLLAKKLKVENDPGFLKQAQKAALYFSNPYWFHYQITDQSWLNETLQEKNLIEKEQLPEAAGLSANEKTIEDSLKQPSGYSNTDDHHDKAVEEKESFAEELNERKFELNEVAKSSEDNVLDKISEQPTQPEQEIAAITRDTDPEAEDFLDEINTIEKTFTRDNLDEVILETQTSAALEATETLEEMAGSSTETGETESFLNEIQAPEVGNIQSGSEQTSIPPFTARTTNGEVNPTEPDEHERMFLNIKAMLDATSEEAEANVENAVIPIDPYYTIDYFASQGIKLELDTNPKDELGQHLKKFTQWLKHMKKLGPEDATEVISRTDTEADIQKIAESSNTVREVVTEAMASVLEKQGKNDKAIELYKKLSFLNPDKSAYFAAKIKNLKGI